MADARFEDGAIESAIRLNAETPEDLGVISALIQDAVAQTSEMSWMAKKRQFTLLLNRFRWEDKEAAERAGRPFERVQTLLMIKSVLKTRAQDINPKDKDLVLNLLGLEFQSGEDLAGVLHLTFAGHGAIALRVECIDVLLQDVSRPYVARSQTVPTHPESS